MGILHLRGLKRLRLRLGNEGALANPNPTQRNAMVKIFEMFTLCEASVKPHRYMDILVEPLASSSSLKQQTAQCPVYISTKDTELFSPFVPTGSRLMPVASSWCGAPCLLTGLGWRLGLRARYCTACWGYSTPRPGSCPGDNSPLWLGTDGKTG